MIALRQKPGRSAGRLASVIARSTRRYASGEHGKTGDEVHHFAGTNTEHGHHHTGPVNESLGTQFYVVLALVPAALGVYALSRKSEDGSVPAFSRFIDSYSYYKEKWAARNTLHTAMIEQAAFDRNLFQSSKGSSNVTMKFPEIFNTGSPFNVPAGQGGANLDKLVAHYEKVNADEEARKVKALAEKEASK